MLGQMKNDWVPSSGPIPIEMTTDYFCLEGFFFEEDRDKIKIAVQCQADGTFDISNADTCVRSNYNKRENSQEGRWKLSVLFFFCNIDINCTTDPPPNTPNMYQSVTNGTGYNSLANYTCGPYSKFQPFLNPLTLKLEDHPETFTSRCQWDKTWTLNEIPTCICKLW